MTSILPRRVTSIVLTPGHRSIRENRKIEQWQRFSRGTGVAPALGSAARLSPAAT
jgi:hypothetical protein